MEPRSVSPVTGVRTGGSGRQRGWAFLGAMALVVVVAFAVASPASAHAQLVRTVPEASAEVASAPRRVEIVFSEDVRPVAGGVRVLDEEGRRVDQARPYSGGGRVRLELPHLPDGAYVVSWRVVSADGHPVRGAFTFRVGGAGSQAVAGRLGEKLLVNGISRADTSVVAAMLRALVLASMALLLGGVAYVVFVGHHVIRSVRRAIGTAGVVGALSSVFSLLVYGPLVTGKTLGAISDGRLLGDSLRDRVGQAMVLRAIFLGVLAYALLARTRRSPRRRMVVDLALAAVAIAVSVAQAFTGHGGSGRHVAVALPSTVVHLLAMGAWAGGLVLLLLTLRSGGPIFERLAVTQRFSRLAGYAVAALVASGSVALWRQVGTVAALRTTSSGRLLLVKLTLVGALLLLGAKNRRALADVADPELAVRAVRRTIGIECIGMAAILTVTALIVNLTPARDAASRPIAVTVTTATGLVDITVDPARAGRNELHMYALTKQGASRPIEAIEATLTNAAAGIEGLESKVVRAGPNHFQALGLDLPIKGTWRIDVRVKLDAFDEETASATFMLR